LGGMHGLAVDDLMMEIDLETDWGGELMRRFTLAAPGELERFMRASSLDAARYRVQFSGVVHECLIQLGVLAESRGPE
jgi:hypothetical protein